MTTPTIPADQLIRGLRSAVAFTGRWRDAFSRQEREDFVQEALIRAWSFWPQLRDKGRFSALVCTMAPKCSVSTPPSTLTGFQHSSSN